MPSGCHLGAYAWVDAPPVPDVVPADGDPVADDPDSEGYMHAARLEHARTAAVLRGGFLARLREGAEAPFAVDLSADRVADAIALLDGVRNGASLGALLGERIERWMIDAGFADRLPAMRDDMPLMDGSGRRRLDGLHAAAHWASGGPTDLGDVPARLNATIDAIGDLLLAESVHHQAAGNPARAQPALTALDSGVTMPAQFDVVTTVADSEPTTWRLVLPLAADAVDAWADGAARRRRRPHRHGHHAPADDDGLAGRRRGDRSDDPRRRGRRPRRAQPARRARRRRHRSSRRPSWRPRSTSPPRCSACCAAPDR